MKKNKRRGKKWKAQKPEKKTAPPVGKVLTVGVDKLSSEVYGLDPKYLTTVQITDMVNACGFFIGRVKAMRREEADRKLASEQSQEATRTARVGGKVENRSNTPKKGKEDSRGSGSLMRR